MSQALGAFGLLDFTMLRPISLGARFETYEPFIYLIFQIFSGRGKALRLNSRIRGSAFIWKQPYQIKIAFLTKLVAY